MHVCRIGEGFVFPSKGTAAIIRVVPLCRCLAWILKEGTCCVQSGSQSSLRAAVCSVISMVKEGEPVFAKIDLSIYSPLNQLLRFPQARVLLRECLPIDLPFLP